ncbi:MAG: malate synthase A [Betaproteobacteria bacterium]|nr:MAG: malate synthase A [Betaproteobacteria bacterium]
MSISLPNGVAISAPITLEYADILTSDALAFVAKLHRTFEPRRQELLARRVARQLDFDAGKRPDFLTETRAIRQSDWTIASLPADLQCRRVEITGPVERKMIINALNSGADSYMADFEDSNTPTWANQIEGHINLKDAVRRTIGLEQGGKTYRLNEKTATLIARPRGWHMDEKHVTVDGKPISGGIFDFALYFWHNAQELLARGSGPYFYLPKMESYLEARLWNDIFGVALDELSIPRGTIKATVLVETITAAFEMDEILYELREHSAGLNAGRWDYIFSAIKKFRNNRNFCLADRGLVTMRVPFMNAYAQLLVKTCHRRNAPAIGGMSALIPIKGDPEANERALEGVRGDKQRAAADGYDGGWVAHPGLVPIAMHEFVKVLGARPHQIDKKRDDVNVRAEDLLDFQPEKPITEAGLRMNINVGIQYLGSWLAGNGCVPIFNLMEDAATAEISRSQIWQWIRSSKGVLEDGRKVSKELFRQLLPEEVEKVREYVGEAQYRAGKYEDAAKMFEQITASDKFVEFLTLPAYETIA